MLSCGGTGDEDVVNITDNMVHTLQDRVHSFLEHCWGRRNSKWHTAIAIQTTMGVNSHKFLRFFLQYELVVSVC